MPVLVRTFGGWFWLHTAYCYVLLAAGCALIGFPLHRTPQWYRGQRGILLFNQPIQGMSGYAELLVLKMDPDDPLYDKIAAIKTQSKKMGDITNRLMGITRYRTARYTAGETIIDIEQSSETLVGTKQPFIQPLH